MRLLSGLLASVGLAALAGCGSTNGSFLATALGVTVDWPEISTNRAVGAPTSAQSAIIDISGANAGGHDVALTINRDVGPAGGSRRYTVGSQVKVGKWDYAIDFYSEPGGTGTVVGTVQGTITVFPDGTSSLDHETVVPTGGIASVVVDAGQVVLVGETKALTITARDAANNIVALPPGAAFFTVTAGSSFLTIAKGQATGVAPGTATVTVTVNGGTTNPITSAPQTVTVTTGHGGIQVGVQ